MLNIHVQAEARLSRTLKGKQKPDYAELSNTSRVRRTAGTRNAGMSQQRVCNTSYCRTRGTCCGRRCPWPPAAGATNAPFWPAESMLNICAPRAPALSYRHRTHNHASEMWVKIGDLAQFLSFLSATHTCGLRPGLASRLERQRICH